MLTKTARPKNLNLLKIRQPVTAVVSIIHRISGVILFLTLPVMIYWFAESLRSAEDFAEAQAFFSSNWMLLAGALLAWALIHHFFAGLRFLLLDIDVGLELKTARATAWLVFACVAIVFVAYMFGVVI